LGFARAFLAFLLVAFALPFGQPSLWVALEALCGFVHGFGVSGSALFFNASLEGLIGEGLLVLVDFACGYGGLNFLIFLDGDVNVFLNMLQVVDIVDLLWLFDSS
jgi:hypothetical protein